MSKEELLDKVTDELLAHAIFSHRGASMNRAYAMDAAKAVIAIIVSCQPADKGNAENRRSTISPGLDSAIQDELEHPPASIMEEGK